MVGDAGDGVGDDAQEAADLRALAVEVVGRQEPEGDVADADVHAPVEEVVDLVRPGEVAEVRVGHAALARVAPVAVEDDADMAGQEVGVQAGEEPPIVDPVREVKKCRHGGRA
jgi:hypothetical protein